MQEITRIGIRTETMNNENPLVQAPKSIDQDEDQGPQVTITII